MNRIGKLLKAFGSLEFGTKKLTPKVLKQLRDFGNFEYSYDPKVFSLTSFFTVFLEREHYSNVKKILPTFKVNYFGEVVDGQVVFAGYQPKDLYDLVEFITENNLWATIEDRKLEDGKRFYKVVQAVVLSGNESLIKILNKYDFDEFRVAYGCVADESHEKIMDLSPDYAGMLGISVIDQIFKEKRKSQRWFKLIARISYLMFFTFFLYSLFTLFN